jgi:tRNA A37 methylthiotransferase MiaB
MRVRFTSPHPKDFPLPLLQLIAERPSLCCSLHLPAQSGSTAVLQRMRRGYTREAYLALAERAREVIPGAALSSDFIAGFCGETEEDHQQTLSLLEAVGYEQAFMFAYSMRERTHAQYNLQDDVLEPVKQRRLSEIISVFRRRCGERNAAEVGAEHLVLVEGPSKRSTAAAPTLTGRTDCNKVRLSSRVRAGEREKERRERERERERARRGLESRVIHWSINHGAYVPMSRED